MYNLGYAEIAAAIGLKSQVYIDSKFLKTA